MLSSLVNPGKELISVNLSVRSNNLPSVGFELYLYRSGSTYTALTGRAALMIALSSEAHTWCSNPVMSTNSLAESICDIRCDNAAITSYEDILSGAVDSHRETKRLLLNYLNEATFIMFLLPKARMF